jgi:hypothetical protein
VDAQTEHVDARAEPMAFDPDHNLTVGRSG